MIRELRLRPRPSSGHSIITSGRPVRLARAVFSLEIQRLGEKDYGEEHNAKKDLTVHFFRTLARCQPKKGITYPDNILAMSHSLSGLYSVLSLPPESAFNNPFVFPVARHILQRLVNLTAEQQQMIFEGDVAAERKER